MLSVIRSTHLVLSTWTRQSTTSVSVHSASPRTFIAQDHHSDQSPSRRARHLDSIQAVSNLHDVTCDRSTPTLSELIGFSACMTLSSQCCSCPYLCVASDHWNSELVVSRVSLQHCLSKSLGALRRCLYCMAFHMQITSALLISVPVTTWLGTGLSVLCIIPLHGSHCSSLIFGVRTWSLAVLCSLGSSCTPFIMLHFCHDFLCTLYCDSSLCSSTKSRRILDNLKSPHNYRFPHLHGYRHCVSQELLAALGVAAHHRLPQWDTLLLVLHHLLAVLLDSVSTVHPKLRSTCPRHTVLALFFA